MRPLRLEMKGFSAFAATTVIDFTGVELLALIGPTGSGKSSIIDAMTFALYGSVARYDERMVVPVINQMAQEARVRFDFDVAGTPYVAARVARRTKGGGATTKEARLESGGVVLAADARSVTDYVTRLLGLDFGRFNKTVVLPQGRFAEFLHDKPSARQELLRELLGFGVYERIGRVARERAKSAENRAGILDQSIGDVGDLSDAHLAACEATAQAIAELQTVVGVAAFDLAKLDTQLAVLGRQAQEGSLAIAAFGAVRVPDGLDAFDAGLAAATSAEDTCAAAWQRARRQLLDCGAAQLAGPSASACLLRLREFAQYRNRTEQHEQIVKRRSVAQQRRDASQAEADLVRAALQMRRAELTEHARLRDEVDDKLRAIGDPSELRSIGEAYARFEQLGHEINRARQNADACEADDLVAVQRLAEAKEDLARTERRVPAAALAAHLHVGEPCPVCRQVVRTAPDPEPGMIDLVAPRARVDAAERHVNETAKRANAAAADVAVAEREVSQLQRRLKGQLAREEMVGRLATWDELHQQVEQQRQVIRRAEAALAAAESSAENRARLAEEASAAQEVAGSTALESQSRSELDQLGTLLHSGPSEASVAADLEQANALATAKTEAEKVEAEAAEHHAAAQVARARLAADEREARDRFDSCRTTLVPWGPPKPVGGLAGDWQALVVWLREKRSQTEEQFDLVRTDQARVGQQREELIDRVSAHVAPFVRANDGTIESIGRALAAAGSTADHELRQLNKDRDRLAKMQAEIVRQRTDASVAGTLGHQLRTSGFERWLLEEALTDLVARATVRLHELTAGQYSLIAEDGAFRIIDHHNADERRDARSLSGGETFLASLALALALADSTLDLSAEGAAPMESIFLDEGFGTLDPDTLEVVAGTIEELGAGGRLVGIVTHIRELADRMPTRFDVRKDASGSSVARVDL